MWSIRIISGLFLLGTSPAAFAACLLGDYSVEAELHRSIAVIVGTVMTERPVAETKDLLNGVTYTVSVDETLHGHAAKTLELFSENSSGRFPMQKGRTYVLFVYHALGRLAVDNCGNSGLVTEKKAVLTSIRKLTGTTHEPRMPN